MAFYSSSKATKARADRPEEFHRLAGPAVKPCCRVGPAKHALPRHWANGYYAVKRETPWTYHAEGKHGIRSKGDLEISRFQIREKSVPGFRSGFNRIRSRFENSKISVGPVASSARGILEFHYSDEHRSVTDRSRGKVSAELHE
ncbi:hypothetical protein X777_13117 [Ooceraea biroi]|uniref:Uncharacterized protein n=1 Tax=Ooceraea biroi TaxID=2015173 RepID=A0A026WXW6_OOCBI|nr:hypothetical protein X777_13117 [Ooceraea biroi]